MSDLLKEVKVPQEDKIAVFVIPQLQDNESSGSEVWTVLPLVNVARKPKMERSVSVSNHITVHTHNTQTHTAQHIEPSFSSSTASSSPSAAASAAAASAANNAIVVNGTPTADELAGSMASLTLTDSQLEASDTYVRDHVTSLPCLVLLHSHLLAAYPVAQLRTAIQQALCPLMKEQWSENKHANYSVMVYSNDRKTKAANLPQLSLSSSTAPSIPQHLEISMSQPGGAVIVVAPSPSSSASQSHPSSSSSTSPPSSDAADEGVINLLELATNGITFVVSW